MIGRDLMTATLEAIAIGGPAVPFVGNSVLGHLFGNASTIPIAVASLVMNLVQVPLSIMLLSAGRAQEGGTPEGEKPPSLGGHVLHALREPVVWAPILALLLVLANVHFAAAIEDSLTLLGRATGGVALFASGIVLFSRRVAVSPAVIVSVVARNIVVPGVIWGVMLLLGVQAAITQQAVVTMAIPTASIAVILAVQYGAAEREMASTLFFSTIFSIVTMGGFIWLTA
jgi:malonate transporter and related proteins